MEPDARQELLRFLDERAFNPILHAPPADLSEADRYQLEELKGLTRQARRRYHLKYRSALEIRRRFLEDLSSRTAAKVHERLGRLGLPNPPDLKVEFVALCHRLAVS